ncbi:MAG: ribosomal protein S18-alanine N-acetyltransferase [Actinomycetota bacterium]
MKETFTIRDVKIFLMSESDLEEVHEIERRIYPQPWSLGIFRGELGKPDKRVYMVARLHNKIVGYAGLMITDSEGHITNLAVDMPYRERKIGTLLALRLIEMAILKGLHWLALEVRESNDIAQRLYTKFGFHSAGVRKCYYSDGENALIMWTDDIASPEYRRAIQKIKKELLSDADSGD